MSVVSLRRRSGWIAIVLLVILAAFYFFGSPLNSSSLGPVPSSAAAQPVGDVPNMPDKPQPQGVTFDGCPPEGDGGDSQLNVIKNRVDRGDYLPVSFDSLLALTWPKTVERQYMKDWSPSALAFIQQYQGIPVSLEGYISSIREAGPEPANCNRDSHANLDWHIYFTKNPRDERSQAIILNATPRVRSNREWTLDLMHAVIMDDHVQARISGWLFFDPDHAGDVGQTRATLWEIHPVMQIEVFQKGRWVPLDKFAK